MDGMKPMEHLPWGAIITAFGLVVGGFIAWGRIQQRMAYYDEVLKECKGKTPVVEDKCDKCRAEIMLKIERDTAALHEYMLKTNDRLGRIDGIVSRHELEKRS